MSSFSIHIGNDPLLDTIESLFGMVSAMTGATGPAGGSTGAFLDSTFEVVSAGAMTGIFKMDVSSVKDGQTRVYSVPDANGIFPAVNPSENANTLVTGLSSFTGYYSGAGYNTVYGINAGPVLALGSYNTLLGYGAGTNAISGQNLTNGNNNTLIGYNSGVINPNDNNATTCGYGTVASNDGTAIGYNARSGQGDRNVSVGYQAGPSVTSDGRDNIAIGTNSLSLNQTSHRNVAIGTNALASNVGSGFPNYFGETTAVGAYALENNTSGQGNTAFGAYAGNHLLTGHLNAALGRNALYNETSGTSNTAVGVGALYAVVGGNNNTAVGANALTSMVSGTNNTALGQNTSLNAARDGCIVIGSGATTLASIANAHLSLGSVSWPIDTQITVGAAGAGAALPATPVTYLQLAINGVRYKIPLYNP